MGLESQGKWQLEKKSRDHVLLELQELAVAPSSLGTPGPRGVG